MQPIHSTLRCRRNLPPHLQPFLRPRAPSYPHPTKPLLPVQCAVFRRSPVLTDPLLPAHRRRLQALILSSPRQPYQCRRSHSFPPQLRCGQSKSCHTSSPPHTSFPRQCSLSVARISCRLRTLPFACGHSMQVSGPSPFPALSPVFLSRLSSPHVSLSYEDVSALLLPFQCTPHASPPFLNNRVASYAAGPVGILSHPHPCTPMRPVHCYAIISYCVLSPAAEAIRSCPIRPGALASV